MLFDDPKSLRGTIDASGTSVPEVQARVSRAVQNADLVPFLVRIELDSEPFRAWARPCDQAFLRELVAEDLLDLTDLLDEAHEVSIALADDVHSVGAASEILKESDVDSDSLLLLTEDPETGDLQPVAVFTSNQASDGGDATPMLAFSAGLPYNPREMHDRTLVKNSPVMLEVRLGPDQPADADPRELIRAAALVGHTIHVELLGLGGIRFTEGDGDGDRWLSPSYTISEDDERIRFLTEFVAVETQPTAKAEIHVRLCTECGTNGRAHTESKADLRLAFSVVGSVTDLQLPESTESLDSAPVWIAAWPIILRPDGDQFSYFNDGVEQSFVMHTKTRSFETYMYGDILQELTNHFSRDFEPNVDQVRRLASIGSQLHELVFGPPGSRVSGSHRTHFQSLSGPLWVHDGEPNVLWELLYDGDADLIKDMDLSELLPGFWGYRFQIEHVPMRNDSKAVARGSLLAGPAQTTAFIHPTPFPDQSLNSKLRDEHQQMNRSLGHVSVEDPDLIAWLDGPEPQACDVIYIFGHGTAATIIDPETGKARIRDNPELNATLAFNEKGPISLNDLQRSIRELPGFPVVFLNACEALLVDPILGNPFVTAFYDIGGSRAVIGAVAEVPAEFAVGFAHQVLERFYTGTPIGKSLHSVKQELLEAGNPYGLLYTLYGPSTLTIIQKEQQ